MSWRMIVLNYVPDPAQAEALAWADAVLHPGLTDAANAARADALLWHSPLKISLPLGEPVPALWRWLQARWRDDYDFDRYTVREDPRACRSAALSAMPLL